MDLKSNNLRFAKTGETVVIGRIKGNIKQGQNIYKLQSKVLNDDISPTFEENKEFRKTKIDCIVNIKENENLSLEINYNNEKISSKLDIVPDKAINTPITKDSIISQISKTGNTPFEFENIKVNLDDGLFVPVKTLNELRRTALESLEQFILDKEVNSRNLKLKEFSSYEIYKRMKITAIF